MSDESNSTFTEAAKQVLRRLGRPAHYNEIADLAQELELIESGGKTPGKTMMARMRRAPDEFKALGGGIYELKSRWEKSSTPVPEGAKVFSGEEFHTEMEKVVAQCLKLYKQSLGEDGTYWMRPYIHSQRRRVIIITGPSRADVETEIVAASDINLTTSCNAANNKVREQIESVGRRA